MTHLLYVAAGGALGCVLRHLVTLWLPTAALPWASFSVNAVGSLLVGIVVVCLDHLPAAPAAVRLTVVVGLLGGFTTFSTFSLETLNLLQSGYAAHALLNIIGSISVCLLAVVAGLFIGRQMLRFFML